MRYRGLEYVKVRGFWRALPGQGTGERSSPRRRKPKRKPGEPAAFWECVNERNGRNCGTKHRTRSGCSTHMRELNRNAWRVRGKAGQTWELFKVVNGRGYHFGVGAPKP
jgi:hypothetical protein